MTEQPLVDVEASPTFKRNIKTLGKKYRSIRQDVEPIIKQLQQGKLPGDKITGVDYSVFKLRVKNSDITKGKSGGYRLIYYCQTATGIILLTIYSKSEQVNIAAEDIRKIISQSENQRWVVGDRIFTINSSSIGKSTFCIFLWW